MSDNNIDQFFLADGSHVIVVSDDYGTRSIITDANGIGWFRDGRMPRPPEAQQKEGERVAWQRINQNTLNGLASIRQAWRDDGNHEEADATTPLIDIAARVQDMLDGNS